MKASRGRKRTAFKHRRDPHCGGMWKTAWILGLTNMSGSPRKGIPLDSRLGAVREPASEMVHALS